MITTGRVAAVNSRRGMVAIGTGASTYTIIELTSVWQVEVGDVLGWPEDHGLGYENYKNLTRNTEATVFVQNHGVHESILKSQLLLN
jgi:hypothetical protein